jgi:hypothetical protein
MSLVMPGSQVVQRGVRRWRCSACAEAGITVVEALIAMILFVVVAVGLAGVLASAINSQGISKERTIAQQVAQDELEDIRRMQYDLIGVVGGNPPGMLQASKSVPTSAGQVTVQTQVRFIDDAPPTSYTTAANYKEVTVTILRARDSKQLAREVTQVAPPVKPGFGGVVARVKVVDMRESTPVPGATVNLGTGPSAPRSDVTDTTGGVTFAGLTPNPSGSSFYDVTVSLAGYETLADDKPPAAAAHVSLAPTQIFDTVLRVYRPGQIWAELHNADGSSYTRAATITVSSVERPAVSETFSYTGSPLTITQIHGELVAPGNYTVSAQSASGSLSATPLTEEVPQNYPTDLTKNFTLTFPAAGAIAVTATQGGALAAGAAVGLAGGPDGISLSATTDASGVATFYDVPPGSGYTVTATKGGQSGSQTASVADGATTPVTVDIPVPPGTVNATVTWNGLPVPGATVRLVGGAVDVSAASGSNGVASFTNVPAGTGYTITASKAGYSVPQTINVASGATTPVSLALPIGPVGSLTVNVKRNGSNQSGATVRVVGGPLGLTLTGTYAGSGGNYTFSSIPAGAGYTLKAYDSDCSVSSPRSDQDPLTVNVGANTFSSVYSLSTCPLP